MAIICSQVAKGGTEVLGLTLSSDIHPIRVQIRLKILYNNFLFIHHEAEVGTWFYIVKTAIQAEICVSKCLKCGVFCSAIQSNSHPAVPVVKKFLLVRQVQTWGDLLKLFKNFQHFQNFSLNFSHNFGKFTSVYPSFLLRSHIPTPSWPLNIHQFQQTV